ncbi:MAG: hypothetical protein KAH32_01225 [Chlamydiia bacterium]|nr:hypothetical protein [Chlamydiia bacterium]
MNNYLFTLVSAFSCISLVSCANNNVASKVTDVDVLKEMVQEVCAKSEKFSVDLVAPFKTSEDECLIATILQEADGIKDKLQGLMNESINNFEKDKKSGILSKEEIANREKFLMSISRYIEMMAMQVSKNELSSALESMNREVIRDHLSAWASENLSKNTPHSVSIVFADEKIWSSNVISVEKLVEHLKTKERNKHREFFKAEKERHAKKLKIMMHDFTLYGTSFDEAQMQKVVSVMTEMLTSIKIKISEFLCKKDS